MNSGSSPNIEVIPLGGGCEVGRSCILVRFGDKQILLDCGIHPTDNDFSSLPFFDKIDPSKIDLLLVTHFHLDHCGSVPYFLEKTKFKGKCFMTYPTKALYKHILLDSLKVGVNGEAGALFGREDVTRSFERITAINFHEEIEEKGIKFTAYNAGHVIGAAMFLIEIGGCRVLYTGDYSREKDLHIMPAEIPPKQVDILIVESTYGTKNHENREARERLFLGEVEKVVRRGGKVLLPVFVLGRAQELLLLLEDFWERTPGLEHVPIYFASALMSKCMLIFQTYINMMGAPVRERSRTGRNPFSFKHIGELRGTEEVETREAPMVVMASPGMLQKGLSRTLFERWCHDKKNSVIFTGYCVESTLARDLQKNITSFKNEKNEMVNIVCESRFVSFSAHADFQQTRDFIESLRPSLVVLVHGEKHEAGKLRDALAKHFPATRFEVPANWQLVETPAPPERKCTLVGSLAGSGLMMEVDTDVFLVKKYGRLAVTKVEELERALPVRPAKVFCKLHVFFPHTLELVYFFAQQVVKADWIKEDGKETLVLGGSLRVRKEGQNEVVLFWQAGQKNDILGDCFSYLLHNLAEFGEDIFAETPEPQQKQVNFEDLAKALKLGFGEEFVTVGDGRVELKDQESTRMALVVRDSGHWTVTAINDFVKKRVENVINLLAYT